MDLFVSDLPSPEGAGGLHERPTFQEITGFGSNPGNLRMHLFVPRPGRMRPLVVVLHGCSQAIGSYDRASGWSRLAAQHDFLLLMPEQRRENNSQTCFSWFEPLDVQRDRGEALSIRQMITRATDDHAVDPARVFVCGLSAGGAMTCAMLATYPDVFAAGAIIAGLPYGVASNVGEAMESMQTGRIRESRVWGDAIRSAAPPIGRWPSVAIWHGTADHVVKPINAGELVKQWTNVHNVGADAPDEARIGKATQRIWRDADGRARVTEYSVAGLGHGAPVDDVDPPAPFFLPAGLSSTQIIAEDWGLTEPTQQGALAFWSALVR